MAATISVLNPDAPKRVLMVASNPATSSQTGWPVGFWWAELSHRDGNLVTGRQQYSGAAAARLVIEALGA